MLVFAFFHIKKWEHNIGFCDSPLLTECLKMQFKILLLFKLSVMFRQIWFHFMIHRSLFSGVTNKKNPKNIPPEMVGYKDWTKNE